MARRASLFERIIDDYSSDTATGARSDRTTPQFAAVIKTPRDADVGRIGDDRYSAREGINRSDFDDEYASDASYVTVDDDFDLAFGSAARSVEAEAHRGVSFHDVSDSRGTDRKYDGDDFARSGRSADAPDRRHNRSSDRLHRSRERIDDSLRTPTRSRRDADETDVKSVVAT